MLIFVRFQLLNAIHSHKQIISSKMLAINLMSQLAFAWRYSSDETFSFLSFDSFLSKLFPMRIREFRTKLLNFPALRYNVLGSRVVNASSASGDEMLKILFVWFTTLLADSSESGGNGSKVEHVRWKAAVFAWRWIYSAPESCLREVD